MRRLKFAARSGANPDHRLALVSLGLLEGTSAMLQILLQTLKPRRLAMNERKPHEDFNCPNCGVQYKLVRVPAQPGFVGELIHCKNCNQELASTDGENILKYFLVGNRRRAGLRVDTLA